MERRRAASWRCGLWLSVVALLISAVAATEGAPEAQAAGPGQYSAPEWWPLRGTHTVGCTNGNGCGGGYHGYWALDIHATRESEIYAAGAGQVEMAVGDQGGNCDFFFYGSVENCPDGSRGNLVRIKHDVAGTVTSYYYHLTSVFVETGDWVDETTLLGTAGDSGLAGPGYVHLHFQVRHGFFGVDPVPLKACHGDQLKSYPAEFGLSSWSQVTVGQYAVRSDGTACEPRTDPGGSTTTLVTTTTTTRPPTTTTTVDGGAPVIGRASGYSVPNLTIFGGVPPGVPIHPTPSVTLRTDAAGSSQAVGRWGGLARFGPATIFSSGEIRVSTARSPRAVTSAVDIQTVNALRTEVFTAARLQATCTASGRGVQGWTRVTGGVLRIAEGDPDVGGDETFVTVPEAPAPNTEFLGRIDGVGDSFRYVFNEQITNPDGSLTVYAAHLRMLGPTAIGDVYIGAVTCRRPPP